MSPILELRGDFYKHPYEIPTPENFQFPKRYPYCCPFHKQLMKSNSAWFKKFPNCCIRHRKNAKEWWFDKKNFKGLPKKIARSLDFTVHHLEHKVNESNWYEDFQDYFHFVLESFGIPAVGEDHFINSFRWYIKDAKNPKLLPEHRQQILIHLDNLYAEKNPVQSHEPTSLTALHEIYAKWLKVFPFELSYFKDLKSKASNLMWFMKGDTHYNQYTGTTKGSVHTNSSLIDSLINLTKTILSKVDSTKLLSSGEINDTGKHQIDLINEAHKLRQNQLLESFNKHEFVYLKILDQWLANEKSYFENIIPLLTKSVEEKKKNEKDIEELKNQKKFSHQQIAIAYCALGVHIDSENALQILQKHSNYKSIKKLMQKRVRKLGDLTETFESKAANTRRLQDLQAAKRLLSGENNDQAVKDLSAVIQTFEQNLDDNY